MGKYSALEHLQAMSPLRLEDLYSVRGKVALVTGGSRGIGLMIAKGLVQNGARVYLVSRKLPACEQVAGALNELGPGSAVPLAADLTSDADCRQLAEELSRRESRLDVLVNNAGATWGGDPMGDFPESGWDKVMRLNVYSVFHLTRACRQLLRAGSNGNLDPSHVINISSVAGSHGWAFEQDNAPSYAASKAAVNKVTQLLAGYLVKDGICVNGIAPAVFPSKMTFDYQLKTDASSQRSQNSHPCGRVGNEQDMAGLALFLASKASAFVTGSVINLDGGVVGIRSSM